MWFGKIRCDFQEQLLLWWSNNHSARAWLIPLPWACSCAFSGYVCSPVNSSFSLLYGTGKYWLGLEGWSWPGTEHVLLTQSVSHLYHVSTAYGRQSPNAYSRYLCACNVTFQEFTITRQCFSFLHWCYFIFVNLNEELDSLCDQN